MKKLRLESSSPFNGSQIFFSLFLWCFWGLILAPMTHCARASSTVRPFWQSTQNICSISITEGFSYLKLFSPTLLTIHLCISKHTVIQGNSIFFIWCVPTFRGRKQFHSKSWRCTRVIIAVLNFTQACAEVRIKPEKLHLSHVTKPIHSYIAFVSIIPKQ